MKLPVLHKLFILSKLEIHLQIGVLGTFLRTTNLTLGPGVA